METEAIKFLKHIPVLSLLWRVTGKLKISLDFFGQILVEFFLHQLS
jgi:hypothetical protein